MRVHQIQGAIVNSTVGHATAVNQADSYTTAGGLVVHRTLTTVTAAPAIEDLIDRLDESRGVLLSSSYEYPGRYTRWDLGFADPLLVITTKGRSVTIEAPGPRGMALMSTVQQSLRACEAIASMSTTSASGVEINVADAGAVRLSLTVASPTRRFAEEERSRQPSVFSVLRNLIDLFRSDDDPHLGLYGAFGYDVAHQFEPIRLTIERPEDQRDIVLYIPDELLIVDHRSEHAEIRSYDFDSLPDSRGAIHSTASYARSGVREGYVANPDTEAKSDHEPRSYAQVVVRAKESFKRGDLFEVVPGQEFTEPCPNPPSELFRRLRERNPAPYGFLINLGAQEWLVGASPEMYVRVEGTRVETCPISGTIARGTDPISDAAQILELLNSGKDESELTMCTDVDRNDKSRICIPGSVKVLGRRQIELYSRLIHTVDHVEGHLRPEFDALDAFLSHTWAVTVTGAPKAWAMQWLEDHERTPRAWYGGAIGMIGFDGRMNTGLTLRTIRVKDGAAKVRVGATLLFDSDPDAEESETELKASAFLDAVRSTVPARRLGQSAERSSIDPLPDEIRLAGEGRRVLLVDHQDSFVHTLASYVRSCGAEVTTWRSGFSAEEMAELNPDLVFLSPGPGRPDDFGLSTTIATALAQGRAVFGVCLGLQGVVEHFGGTLDVLDIPMHGKPSLIHPTGPGVVFGEEPVDPFAAGRYHSLYANRSNLPGELSVTAMSDDGIIMGIEHQTLPVAAVQFHPESIMSLAGNAGMRLIARVLRGLR
jgi:anthranilate synthase